MLLLLEKSQHRPAMLWFAASCEAVAGISPLPGSCRTAGRCFADRGMLWRAGRCWSPALIQCLPRLSIGIKKTGLGLAHQPAPSAHQSTPISAVSVSCCAHLSAPDVWQLVVLGAAASLPSHAGNSRLLSSALSSANRRGWIFKGLSVAARWLVTLCRFVCGMGVL